MSAASRPRRRRRSGAVLTELVAGFPTSGLSRQAFCQAHGLAPTTLERYWRDPLSATPAAPPASPQWLAVELAPPPPVAGDSGLTLLLASGHRLALHRGFCPVTLAAVLRALERA